MQTLSIDNMDLESNLAMIENVEFEEKVDIDDLVLPPKPIALAEIEVNEIKQEPIVEKNQHAAYKSDLDVKKALLNRGCDFTT